MVLIVRKLVLILPRVQLTLGALLFSLQFLFHVYLAANIPIICLKDVKLLQRLVIVFFLMSC